MKKKKKQVRKRQLKKERRKLKQTAVVYQKIPRTENDEPVKKARPSSANHEFNLRLLLIPLILLVILGIVSLLSTRTTKELEAKKIEPVITTPINPYAFLQNPIQPPISAEAAIIMDSNSKVILYQKNADARFAMASTTKLMTALVAMEYFQPQDILTVTTPDVGGQTLSFPLGEKLYFQDLLYAMLLPSSNHAANIIAHNYPGGYEAFMTKMNQKAASLSLSNTHYIDPAGLNDQGNYTTVIDLARLASEAIHNKTLAVIAATKFKTITNVSNTRSYSLSNLNILLGKNGVTGLKTGYTEGAGGVLATSAVADGRTFIIVVMRSQDRFADTRVLLSYLTSDLDFFTPQLVAGEHQ